MKGNIKQISITAKNNELEVYLHMNIKQSNKFGLATFPSLFFYWDIQQNPKNIHTFLCNLFGAHAK